MNSPPSRPRRSFSDKQPGCLIIRGAHSVFQARSALSVSAGSILMWMSRIMDMALLQGRVVGARGQAGTPRAGSEVGANHPERAIFRPNHGGGVRMNVIVLASRKGGSGKSTLTAHLAAHAQKPSRPVLLIDAAPQGSLTLWHQFRGGEPPLCNGSDGVADIVKAAKREGYEWVFI